MRTLIIAEAGVNHNGDMDMAKEMIDVAADAGADLIKFQTLNAERMVTRSAKKAEYQKRNSGYDESQYEMLHRLELTDKMHYELIEHCNLRGIGFLSTGFDIESVNFLLNFGPTYIKVPSGEITNLLYLRHVGRLGKSVILSTGMSTLGDIESAINVLEGSGLSRENLVVMHCTTEYPTPMGVVNLRAMTAIRMAFGVEVGYSDHTLGIEVAIAAVALGATIIEKHFTLDRCLPGPDHQASLEPNELATMVSSIRNVEIALGNGIKKPSPGEKNNMLIARKSLVASREILVGEPFTVENIAIKRPGNGISPMEFDRVLGRVAGRHFSIDELIEL